MKYYFVILTLIRVINCDTEYLVAEGNKALITDFPHSVSLEVLRTTRDPWSCGASIVNQKILLTSGHCMGGLTHKDTMIALMGHSDVMQGAMNYVVTFLVHSKFDSHRFLNDIALVILKKNLNLDDHIQRVALMNNPPYHLRARVAGWSIVMVPAVKLHWDGVPRQIPLEEETRYLHYVDQIVWDRKLCNEVVSELHAGMICASNKNTCYTSGGDSGSALVVRGYIQIGLVSYKMPDVNRSLVVYTDTGFYYDWIRKYSRYIYCYA